MTNWVPLKGFESTHEISSDGEVKSLSRVIYNSGIGSYYENPEKVLKPTLNHAKGYLKVGIRVNGKNHQRYIHRLLYETFVGDIPEGYEINHIDEDNLNNDLSNLECVTPIQNKHHGTRITRCAKGHEKPVIIEFEDGSTEYFDSATKLSKKYPKYLFSNVCQAVKNGKPYKGARFFRG